jgi:hypothetical protein
MRDATSPIFPQASSEQTVRSELTRVIHFGPDDCFRIPILKGSGYSVDLCNSASQLHAALQDVDQKADAVAIVENKGIDPSAAIFLTRMTSEAALILFQSKDHSYDESGFDHVVRVPSSPSEWLGELTKIIERRRSVRPPSRPLSAWRSNALLPR